MAWDLVLKQFGGSIFFACNNDAPACVMQWPWWVPTVSLSTNSHLLIPLSCWPCGQCQTAVGTASEPRRRTTARPRTGTNWSSGRCGSVVAGGGEYEGNNMQVKLTNGTKSPRINCSSNLDKTRLNMAITQPLFFAVTNKWIGLIHKINILCKKIYFRMTTTCCK